jgi:ADP-ribose pyrophosphatase YjhB (NUDIX family)
VGEIRVVCGALAFKGDKFVLVKEAQKSCYGKWNYPAGHLDLGEDILSAAVREVKEETNLDVTLQGLIGIYEHDRQGNNVVKFIFRANVISGELRFNKGELLDAKWFTFKEFESLDDSEIRTIDLRKTIADCQLNKLIPLSAFNIDFINKEKE